MGFVRQDRETAFKMLRDATEIEKSNSMPGDRARRACPDRSWPATFNPGTPISIEFNDLGLDRPN